MISWNLKSVNVFNLCISYCIIYTYIYEIYVNIYMYMYIYIYIYISTSNTRECSMIKIEQYIYFRSRNRWKLYISQLQDLTSLQVLKFFFFFIRGNKKTLMIVNIRESWSCEIYSFRLFFCTCTPEIYIYIYIHIYIYYIYIYIYI